MTTLPVPLPVPEAALDLMWPVLGPMLAPAVRRSPDAPDVLAELRARNAQLWMVCEAGRPIAAVVTKVLDHDDGQRRCLLWLIGGRGARQWADGLLGAIEAWARPLGCVALWGCGRRGWARLVEPRGFQRIADVNGQPAWQRRMA